MEELFLITKEMYLEEVILLEKLKEKVIRWLSIVLWSRGRFIFTASFSENFKKEGRIVEYYRWVNARRTYWFILWYYIKRNF